MPIYSFEFKTVRFGGVARPYVPVVLTNPHSGLSTSVYGLVDTGADDCALPAAFAPLLGVQSFLSRFTVTIDYPGQKFALEN